MTALPPMVTERTVVTERTMVMERTVVAKRTVVMGTVQRATAVGGDSQNRDGNSDGGDEESQQWPRGMQHAIKPEGGCLHRRPDISGRRNPGKEHRKEGDSSRPATGQRHEQEEGKEASPQVSGIPPGRGTIYRPLPEESGTVPERRQKEASIVPPSHSQKGCREGSTAECGLLAQVMGTGT